MNTAAGIDHAGLQLLDTFVENLQAGRAMDTIDGTPAAITTIVDTVRYGVLATARHMATAEAADPRLDPPADTWLDSEGYYLGLIADRLDQLLESADAVATLARHGAHRPGWAVLTQAASTLLRMWMLTETTVTLQPGNEARRSSQAWINTTAAIIDVTSIDDVEPHPFDIWNNTYGNASGHPDADLAIGIDDGPPSARAIVEAILQTGALSTVHVPTARQAGPDAQATMPTDDTGLTSPEMIRAQAQLTIALVHSAAHSTHAALQASHETRTPPRP